MVNETAAPQSQANFAAAATRSSLTFPIRFDDPLFLRCKRMIAIAAV